ncbi:MAG: RNA polymerase sigma factor [Flavobacteriales bacterium]|jgi:RNA polymerase sigma-70 factor (ECF subfamily)|nr:RNA polymerase sigma factor [Flavobacteriales bacterium]
MGKLDHISHKILGLLSSGNAQAAFDLIIQEYNQKIYWHIRRIIISHDDTNDVLQNTFIKIWKGLLNYKGEAKIYTWIYRIATNESITFLNKQKKAPLYDGTTQEPYTTQAAIQMDATEIEKRLELALLTLPEKQRIVFNLKYFEDMKYEDISAITQTSVGALKASYHLAVKKIEKFLTSN